MNMTSAPTIPMSTVAERDIRDMAVRLRMTLFKQTLHALAEDIGFAVLGVITLDDTHAAQRLGQTSGHLRVNFGALAEDGADGFESPAAAPGRTPGRFPSETSVRERTDAQQNE